MDFYCRSAVLGPVQKRCDSPPLPSIARKLTTGRLWGAIENSADRPHELLLLPSGIEHVMNIGARQRLSAARITLRPPSSPAAMIQLCGMICLNNRTRRRDVVSHVKFCLCDVRGYLLCCVPVSASEGSDGLVALTAGPNINVARPESPDAGCLGGAGRVDCRRRGPA